MSSHDTKKEEKKKVWQDGEFEESIYLRDVFGRQYSFADDPSKRQLEGSDDKLRQRKPQRQHSMERIRRPKSTGSESKDSRSPLTRSRSYQHHRQEKELPDVMDVPADINFEPSNSEKKLPNLQLKDRKPSSADLEMARAPDSQKSNVNDNSQPESVFHDEPSSSTIEKASTIEDPISKRSKPLLIIESKRRTCCIGCSLCWLIVGVFGLVNGISVLIFKPEPEWFILNETKAPLAQQSQPTTTQSPQQPNPLENVFQHSNDMVGELPPETLETMAADPDSPPGMALRWMNADKNWEGYSIDRRRQRFALAALYFGTNPPFEHNWKDGGYWLSYDVSECKWQPGQSMCEEESMIVDKLMLSDNNLKGELPMEVSFLTNLTVVHLQGNKGLTGTLPEGWCDILDLQFDCANQRGSGLCGCGDCAC